MRTTLAVFTFWVMLFLFTSCYTNLVYFDLETQSVIRCNGTISRLNIISTDNKDDLHFSIMPGKKAQKSFSLKEINKDYSLETTNPFITLKHFRLRPETEYTILHHSNGDCPDGELTIRTDKNSSIIYADKTSCK